MTDDQNPTQRQDAEGQDVLAGELGAPENGTDPTPAPEGIEADATDGHSAWMRPDDDAPQLRTSEVVGALDEQVAPVATAVATPEPTPRTGGAHRAPRPTRDPLALPPHQAASLIGARAARARTDAPGASLTHAPSIDELPTGAPPAWRRWLPIALVGMLALALVCFGIGYAATRKPVVVVTPTPSATPSGPELVAFADLLTPAQARPIDPKQTWAIASTLDRVTSTTPTRIACLAATTGQPNPTQTRQRALTTTSKQGLAAIHQIDGYASPADAKRAYAMRSELLGTCTDAPTWILKSSAVSGLGDEATTVTIADQGLVTRHHTVVLTRTGTVVNAFDVTQAGADVAATPVVAAAAAVVNRQCAKAQGQCATRPVVSAAFPPASASPGWLMTSDLPRVTPGAGLWSSTDTTAVTTRGSTCENLDLATAPGPSRREQRSYLMTQDNAAPQNYGTDVVVLTFRDAKAAAAFASTLASNLVQCPTKQVTAKVSEAATARESVGRVSVQASTLLVTQNTGGGDLVRFRTGVVNVGNKVVYLVNNPSASYDMHGRNFMQVALRAGERASQAA